MYDICIIGAGFAGICAGIKLNQDYPDCNFVIIDENEEVGGTWLVNRYPGCACDIASHLYSYSFEPNHDWSESYSSQEEIWQYIQRVVEKYDIRRHIQLKTQVLKSEWMPSSNRWRLSLRNKSTDLTVEREFHVVINAVGGLRVPSVPPQFENTPFAGSIMHSATWNKELDLKDKRVAVIGTGASATQIIPSLAGGVRQLEVFQRSATWTVSRWQVKYPWIIRKIFQYVPFVMRIYRCALFWTNELLHSNFIDGSFLSKLGVLDHKMNLRKHILDKDLRAKLTPSYGFGCKRIVKTDDLFPALARDNVRLHTSAIDAVTKDGLICDGKAIKVDVIILATGFRVQDFFFPMSIVGRDSVDVLQRWRDESPRGYLGIMSSLMPNSFAIIGPGTGLGHNSIIFMIECQVNYIIQMLQEMQRRRAVRCEVTPQAEEEFCQFLKANLKNTVWASPTCKSWYANDKGEVTALWPHSCFAYWRETYRPNFSKFIFT